MPRWKIVEHKPVAERMMWLEMECPPDIRYEPGQFLHIRVTEGYDHLLRRPLSVCLATEAGLVVVYRISGKGTALLAQKRPGDALDVLGPLGRGFPMHTVDRHVLLIGGGIGVPPLLELARQLHGRGVRVTAAVGFQTQSQAILIRELEQYGEVLVATDDGSLGRHGLVTAYLDGSLPESCDRFYACGPTAMLAAVQQRLAGRLDGYLSLEERMGCGVGVCMGCVHLCMEETGVAYKRVCRTGPVFPAKEVMFDV
jgi:dihydroorotate dehydrogenase electron transfer subunit